MHVSIRSFALLTERSHNSIDSMMFIFVSVVDTGSRFCVSVGSVGPYHTRECLFCKISCNSNTYLFMSTTLSLFSHCSLVVNVGTVLEVTVYVKQALISIEVHEFNFTVNTWCLLS